MSQLQTAPAEHVAPPPAAPGRGDPDVLAADATQLLYEQHSGRILAFCISRLRNRQDAEDAVQTTFAYAFNALRRGVKPESELAWLFTIAHNACRTRQRSLRRRSQLETSTDPVTLEETAPAGVSRSDELRGLREALLSIPASQRRALLLREWQGLSYREIAGELAVSQSAVETLLFRARRTLAERLQTAGQAVTLLVPTPLFRLFRRWASTGTGAGTKTAAATLVLGLAAAAPYATYRSHRPSAPAIPAGSAVRAQSTETPSVGATLPALPAHAPVQLASTATPPRAALSAGARTGAAGAPLRPSAHAEPAIQAPAPSAAPSAAAPQPAQPPAPADPPPAGRARDVANAQAPAAPIQPPVPKLPELPKLPQVKLPPPPEVPLPKVEIPKLPQLPPLPPVSAPSLPTPPSGAAAPPAPDAPTAPAQSPLPGTTPSLPPPPDVVGLVGDLTHGH